MRAQRRLLIPHQRHRQNCYQLIAAQNFLSSISLDGTHRDTVLSIFDEPGLKLDGFASEEEANIDVLQLKQSDSAAAEENVCSKERTHLHACSVESTCRSSHHEPVCRCFSSERTRLSSADINVPCPRSRRRVHTAEGNFWDELSEIDGERAQLTELSLPSTSSAGPREFLSEKRIFFKRFGRKDGNDGERLDYDESYSESPEKLSVLSTFSGLSFLKCWRAKNDRYCLSTNESAVPILVFTHFPYVCRKLDSHLSTSEEHLRHLSTTSADIDLKPIDFKEVEEVSFRHLLFSDDLPIVRNPLHVRQPTTSRRHPLLAPTHLLLPRGDESTAAFTSSARRSRSSSHESLTDYGERSVDEARRNSTLEVDENTVPCRLPHRSPSKSAVLDYDPDLIANFESENAFRKTTMRFTGYVAALMTFAEEEETKRVINEKFRALYPQVQISYSKIKSIEKEMLRIAELCDLDDLIVAHAYVFYEKVLLNGMVGKGNRKLVAGAALLVAAKVNDFGSVRLSNVVDKIESSFRVNRKELLHLEIPLCVALDFSLQAQSSEILPHYERICFLKF